MLADDIAAILSEDPGTTAASLAARLEVSEREISFALFAAHGRFWSDCGTPARWWLAADSAEKIPPRLRVPAVPTVRPSATIGLYPWQAEALQVWERRGGRGVVEAVTGAGKTMVGVAAVLDERWRRGQVVVLVPTVELQDQWVAQLSCYLGDGGRSGRVGRLGAGRGDSLATSDVLVAVVNSARAGDVRPIRQGGLLIADECHRYGSAVNRLALDQRFRHRLGLSATYAREDDGNLAWLDPYFGGIVFRLAYGRAVAEGVTARFSVTLIGVLLSAAERARYDQLTDVMAGLRARLLRQYGVPAEPFDMFLRAVAELVERDGEGSGVARSYRQALLERRRLLADTPTKDDALALLAPAMSAAERSMVFTQSITASERAARVLAGCGLQADVIHSGLPGPQRASVMHRFGAGQTRVLAAPRVLDEGIDVPVADLAVIAGASRSRRQMIQRMGRVLRRKPDKRRARFAVLFVEDTVEDPRFGAHEAFLGEIVDIADRVCCFPAADAAARPGAVVEALRP